MMELSTSYIRRFYIYLARKGSNRHSLKKLSTFYQHFGGELSTFYQHFATFLVEYYSYLNSLISPTEISTYLEYCFIYLEYLITYLSDFITYLKKTALKHPQNDIIFYLYFYFFRRLSLPLKGYIYMKYKYISKIYFTDKEHTDNSHGLWH